MTQGQENRTAAKLLLWLVVGGHIVLLTLRPFDSPWTNWNVLYFASEILLFCCLFRRIPSLEPLVARWISYLMRRLECLF